ncbi:MAG TPA: guanylate kinase, partial [Lachnospiraceae bacterium]|nr:guanylate kinase [Lachnospiraceae bacterium]
YIFGKSSTGKDTIYRKIAEDTTLDLKNIVMYTTRPIRDGEQDGNTYYFVTENRFEELKEAGKIIEDRAYHTVHGLWRYFTVDDGQIDLENNDYFIIGVLQSYLSTKAYFGKDKVVPIYIELDDGIRLQRALDREKKPENRKFAEMCRRYLADAEDFSEEKLIKADIGKRFINEDLEKCVSEIKQFIRTDDLQ